MKLKKEATRRATGWRKRKRNSTDAGGGGVSDDGGMKGGGGVSHDAMWMPGEGGVTG